MYHIQELSQDLYNLYAGQVDAAINAYQLGLVIAVLIMVAAIILVIVGLRKEWDGFNYGFPAGIAGAIGLIVFGIAYSQYNTLITNPDMWVWNKVFIDMSCLL